MLEYVTNTDDHKGSYYTASYTHAHNRYSNIVPVGHTMVSLQTKSKLPADSYINANYIANPYNGQQRYFIATQGPIPQSMVNFWQMV